MRTSVAFIVAIVAVNLLLGPLCLVVARFGRGSAALRLWGSGLLLYTSGLLCLLASSVVDRHFALFAGETLITLAPVWCVRGMLTHTPSRLGRRLVGSLVAMAIAVLAQNNFGPEPSDLVNLVAPTLVAILLFLAGAVLLLRGLPADARLAARLAAGGMLYAAALWSARLLFYLGAWPELLASDRRETIDALLAVGHVVGTVALTFALLAIEVESMQSALRRAALTDLLTGLPNRRATIDRFREEVARAARRGEQFAMLLVDVDHFKRVNDEHGHLAGDAVLQQLARLLAGGRRGEDAIGRIGGEEFVVLLAHGAPDGFSRAAERIRETVSSERFVHDDRTLAVTVSLGLALFPLDGETWDDLFVRADERLYASKRGGRNRVTGPGAGSVEAAVGETV